MSFSDLRAFNREFAEMKMTMPELKEWQKIVDALRAVVGHGYTEKPSPAGQDYVSKLAIAKVRRAVKAAEKLDPCQRQREKDQPSDEINPQNDH